VVMLYTIYALNFICSLLSDTCMIEKGEMYEVCSKVMVNSVMIEEVR
jgi:hypothetical protein